jgi:hypothetical protein
LVPVELRNAPRAVDGERPLPFIEATAQESRNATSHLAGQEEEPPET